MKNKTPHVNIHDALLLDGDPDNITKYYKKWAATYDEDVTDNYYGIQFICELMHTHLQCDGVYKNPAVCPVIDVGCGTGLLGQPLSNLGYRVLDGLDLSVEMLEKARLTGFYRQLYSEININEPVTAVLHNTYAATICIGTFTPGHVLPESLYQLASITKQGGLIVLSTRIPYYEQTNYQQVSDQLQREKILELIQTCKDAPYRDDGDAHYWVYKVC